MKYTEGSPLLSSMVPSRYWSCHQPPSRIHRREVSVSHFSVQNRSVANL